MSQPQTTKTNPTAPTSKPTAPTAPASKDSPANGTGAARTESAASKASRSAPLNLAALTFDTVAAPVRKPSRTRDISQYRPLMTQLKASWDETVPMDPKLASKAGFKPEQAGKLVREIRNGKGGGRRVVVPTSASKQLVSMVRVAADLLGDETGQPIGTAVVAIPVKDDPSKTEVSFCAKRRRDSHK